MRMWHTLSSEGLFSPQLFLGVCTDLHSLLPLQCRAEFPTADKGFCRIFVIAFVSALGAGDQFANWCA
jgi:hypothetical protein